MVDRTVQADKKCRSKRDNAHTRRGHVNRVSDKAVNAYVINRLFARWPFKWGGRTLISQRLLINRDYSEMAQIFHDASPRGRLIIPMALWQFILMLGMTRIFRQLVFNGLPRSSS